MNFEIFLAIGMFTAIVLALVVMILIARARLVSDGDVTININGERTITVPAGGKLLQTLAGNNIFLSSACGGVVPVRSVSVWSAVVVAKCCRLKNHILPSVKAKKAGVCPVR